MEERAGRLDVLVNNAGSLAGCRRLATRPDGGPTGGYFEDAGTIPW